MASKTSASTGMLVSVVLLGTAALVLFILTVIFFSKSNRLQGELTQATASQRDVITPDQRAQYEAQIQAAQRNRQTLVGYLNDSMQQTMRRVSGVERMTADELATRLEEMGVPASTPALSVLNERRARIESLRQELEQTQAAAARAQADLAAEVEARQAMQSEFDEALAAANAELGQYKAEVESYRSGVTETIAANNTRVDTIRRESADQIALLNDQIDRLREEALIVQGQLDELRAERRDQTLRPRAEESLVDGRVVNVNPVENVAYIDLTEGDRLVLGMTFEVYGNGSQIRPNREGEYPPGKATVEVIRVGERSSTARVIRETRGNPVIAGDVIANAIYDPAKQYRFVVFGAFDTNRDGVATQREAEEIRAIINEWGGQTQEDVGGDTDFLVLGERPLVPPQPPVDAPFAVVQEYARLQRASREYDRLFETANKTGIPVLNQNRLYTLTGLGSRR